MPKEEHVSPSALTAVTKTIDYIKLSLIDDNPYNPRSVFNPEEIAELAHSIKEVGLRQIPEGRKVGDRYQLAYGHRRKRAFDLLFKEDPEKYSKMPVEVKELTDEEIFYYALHENLMRKDLKPMDVARSVNKYFEVFPKRTEAELAKNLNYKQATISNMRRVLTLPGIVLDMIDAERINYTQARDLLIFSGLTKRTGGTSHSLSEDDMMVSAINKLAMPGEKAEDGKFPNTVEGMLKALDAVAAENFTPLQKGTIGNHFDATDDVCLGTCKFFFLTHPTKKISNHWCLDKVCWNDKEKKYQDKVAAEAAEEEAARKHAAPPPPRSPVGPKTNAGVSENPENVSNTPPVVSEVTENVTETDGNVSSPAEQPPIVTCSQAVAGTPVISSKGEALKASEVTAMKAALEKTTTLDKGRMMLVLMAQIDGYHINPEIRQVANSPYQLFWGDVSPETPEAERSTKVLFQKISKLSDADIAKLIVEFSLYALQYKGPVDQYEIKLKEVMGWLGIKIAKPEK